jgi:hypothetical protein
MWNNERLQALFVPTTRYQDLHRIRSREVRSERLPDDWREVELTRTTPTPTASTAALNSNSNSKMLE